MGWSTTETSSASSSKSPDRGLPALVLVDTNGWFLPIRSPLRLEPALERAIGAHRIAVPSSVLGELDRLIARGVTGATAARRLAGRYPVIETPERGDAGVVACARAQGAWILTGDRALLARIRGQGLRGLAPRGTGELTVALPRRKTLNGARRMKRRPPGLRTDD